jgi:mitogen-activated protein kinase kinase kinase 9
MISGVGIKTIACGLIHSGCVLSDGSVYQWGTCGDYQYISKDNKVREKAICQYPTKVSFRHCAETATAVSGGGLSSRKASAQEDDLQAQPVIVDIKMGEQFTIAMSIKGYVYTWGMNDKGQLGNGSETPAFEPF